MSFRILIVRVLRRLLNDGLNDSKTLTSLA